jgi:hypothetical protein
MLERLCFKNIGPGREMMLAFGERLNLLTGDNGLGKTFVLDAAWWALTRTWADDKPLEPPLRATEPPEVSYHVYGIVGANRSVTCKYDLKQGEWKLPVRRPPIPGLVVYARVDSGFSIWDPARNYWRPEHKAPERDRERPSSFQFTRRQVWSGLWRSPRSELERLSDDVLCRGLVEDVVTWWQKGGAEIELFKDLLQGMSPEEPLELSEPAPIGRGLVKVPTFRVSYSREPIRFTEASAGIRRMLSLAYMLAWAWLTHLEEVQAFPKRSTKATRLVLLIDEIECHLHPEWQRRMLPGLMKVVRSRLLTDSNVALQIIATTHAPLVLASVEPHFNESTDRLFLFEVTNQKQVTLHQVPWAPQGDALNWLVSETFGLKQARSMEGERAVEAAEAWMRHDCAALPANLQTADAIDAELRRVLADNDRFKPRWSLALARRRQSGTNQRK